MVGFDADDTLWRSQDYFDAAQLEFERIVGVHADLSDDDVRQRLYEVEGRNISVFGYGVKGMVLSMIEAAVELCGARISALELHRIVELGKELLRHPVELLPDIREAVEAIGRDFEVVLITKGEDGGGKPTGQGGHGHLLVRPLLRTRTDHAAASVNGFLMEA